ncbi:glutathione S-transferase family protein [Prosthecomicrobium sp. N25]|uniref:glutathione S-transferase family protein n=1 Tax=Prosthecomicrobium sp. N25 TaxID=3129254 RepID=UPI0030789E22
MAKVQIIGAPFSTYVRVCRIVAEEKVIDYDLVAVAPHTPAVDAVHPLGKIPVMRHGDLELFESRAIVGYLDRVFPGPRMIPEDPVAAAKVEEWVSLVNTALDDVLIRKYAVLYLFAKDGGPDRARIDAILPKVEKALGLIAAAVAENGYLVGDGFTYADANIAPILHYLAKLPESGAMIEASGALKAAMAAHAARPSVAKTVP